MEFEEAVLKLPELSRSPLKPEVKPSVKAKLQEYKGKRQRPQVTAPYPFSKKAMGLAEKEKIRETRYAEPGNSKA